MLNMGQFYLQYSTSAGHPAWHFLQFEKKKGPQQHRRELGNCAGGGEDECVCVWGGYIVCLQ